MALQKTLGTGMKKPQMPLHCPAHSAATAWLHWNFFDARLLSGQRQISWRRACSCCCKSFDPRVSQLATLPPWFCMGELKFCSKIWWQMDSRLALFYVAALWSEIISQKSLVLRALGYPVRFLNGEELKISLSSRSVFHHFSGFIY